MNDFHFKEMLKLQVNYAIVFINISAKRIGWRVQRGSAALKITT